MCGITGFYQFNIKHTSQNTIKLMTAQLTHRGPDDSGAYMRANVALGHRRLSILDLSSAGHQPMLTDSGNLVIVFNGEIYNFLELKRQLIALGHCFKSQTDTEVILQGFEAWGIALFSKLNGIFAFAIWDNKNSKLYLVRDRLGVKPLYIYHTNDILYFGSEIKAIRSVCPELCRIDKDTLSSFLYYGNSLGDSTLFNNVKKVPPGHFLIADKNGVKTDVYWAPENIVPTNNISENEAVENIKALLEKAVERQLISDVPLGVFLSGGIDSSAITAFASRHSTKKINTFTASFEFETGGNELSKAKEVAKYFNTNHQEFFIEVDTLPDVIEKMIYHHDEPFSDAANIPLYLMSKHIKPFASVVLQGDGGDEIFGGYRRYRLLNSLNFMGKRKIMHLLSNILSGLTPKNVWLQRLDRLANALGQKDDAMLMAFLLTVDTVKQNTFYPLNSNLQHQLASYNPFEEYKIANDRFKDKDIVQRMLYVDTQIILPNTFLEKVDKSTMAASVEARVPLLDNDLVEYVMALPSHMKVRNGEKKWLIKKALRGVVPDHVLDLPKTGFGVPYENWLRKPLYNLMNDYFRTDYIKNLNMFDYGKLDKMVKEHRDGTVNHGFSLWKLMNLCIWMRANKIELK